MLKEWLQHIRRQRLEAERESVCVPAESNRKANAIVRTHPCQPAVQQIDLPVAVSRSTILKQLNTILATREIEQGFVVALTDDLFDGLRLSSVAPEKLRRITHPLLSHPGVTLSAEVDTIGTGTENDESGCAERIFDVMKYLVAHGVHGQYICATGLVKTNAVTHLRSATRRAANFELLVSSNAGATKLRGAAAAA